ncbi:hypothetical protein H9P43_009911 [Blastocladiella emersonii ATCC 22665]|nr:hypothetical protein H9P43_009911 [Blastocladiella emersonii ATCC 22665]
MGNGLSSFKNLPLASEQHAVAILARESCFDACSTMTVTTKGVINEKYFVSVNNQQLFTMEARALASKCTIHDNSGQTIASVRGRGSGMTKYTVHSGTSGGKKDPATPAAMTVKRRSSGLEVTTATGITMTVAFGSSRAFVFLGDMASTTAPLIARISSSGTLKTTYTIEVAAGVDTAAVLALWVVMKMIIANEGALMASTAATTSAAVVVVST